MKSTFLFPNEFKTVGWAVLFPSLFFGIYLLFHSEFEWSVLDWEVPWYSSVSDNFLDEFVMILVLVSSMLVAFSKTQEEDEYVQQIRMESLLWAMYMNGAFLFIGIIGIYDFDFFYLLMVNAYAPLFIFIIRFQYYYKNR
jgi:hypothetical protein